MSLPKKVKINTDLTVIQLADLLNLLPSKIVAHLFSQKHVALTVSQRVQRALGRQVAVDFGFELDDSDDDPDDPSAPVPKMPIAPTDTKGAEIPIPEL